MAELRVRRGRRADARLRVPGDKSITHRALLLGALAEGETVLQGYLDGGDCQATIGALEALGVAIAREGPDRLVVVGPGAGGLRAPRLPLDCRNSGTTMRLLAGVLAGQPFDSVLDGSAQLRRRPMRRVTEPLEDMGARIETRGGAGPLRVTGTPLTGAHHRLTIASAQVKSALLLAGLHADGETIVEEPGPSRDHTERLLRAMGAPLSGDPARWRVRRPDRPLAPLRLSVPGDPSSAAFPFALAAGAGGRVVVERVGVNPTRTGFLTALGRMGATVSVGDASAVAGEPVADVEVRGGDLVGRVFQGDEIVGMIDELPALAVVATQAAGETVVRDAGELRVKETDRIDAMVTELRRLGAAIEPLPDGFVVMGPSRLRGASVSSRGDHRLAMALAVAGAMADHETVIEGAECCADSYPGFDRDLARLGARVEWG
jgi:3-phosphoshikimate 1-carboxyvinyltransferase